MTNEVDKTGYFILDRHALVTIHLTKISHILINSVLPTTVLEVGFRTASNSTQLPENSLIEADHIEVGFDDIFGGTGSIFAKSVEFTFSPGTANA